MNKRGNGEANIRLRDDGRWQASTLVAAADGSRKRHYVYGVSRAEVQSKLDDIRQRVRGGQPAVDLGITLGAYLDRWLVDGLTDHKATTRENYSTMVRKHITPAIGSVRLDKLSPLDVQEEAGVLSGEVSNCLRRSQGWMGRSWVPREVQY